MKQTKAILCVIFAGVLFATSVLFVNALTPRGFSSLEITAARGVSASLFMIVLVLFKNRRLFKTKLTDLLLYMIAGLATFGTSSAYFVAMQASSASTAVMLLYTAPVLVMICSVAFLGEKLTATKAVAVVCMLLGCGLVSGIIGGIKFSWFGIGMGLLSGISYAAYNVITKIEMRRHCDPLTASMYTYLFMTVIALCFINPVRTVSVAFSDPLSVVLLFSCGFVTCAMSYLFLTLGLKDLPAGTASTLCVVEPICATLFSVAFLGETLSWVSVGGIVLVVAAICLLSRNEMNKTDDR